MIEADGDKIGDTQHGAWDSKTGLVTAHDSGTSMLGGDAPASADIFVRADLPLGGRRRECETLLFSANGNAPATVATKPGGEYLNYAILAGGQRRVYGVNLGAFVWLYRADDWSVWSAEVTSFHDSRSTNPWSVRPSITLRRFGRFVDTATDIQLIECVRVDIETLSQMTGGDTTGLYISIDDITVDGSRALCAVAMDFSGDGIDSTEFCSFFEIVISGTPPAATAVVVTHSQTARWDSLYIETTGSPLPDNNNPLWHFGVGNNTYIPTRDIQMMARVPVMARYRDGHNLSWVDIVVTQTLAGIGVVTETSWSSEADGSFVLELVDSDVGALWSINGSSQRSYTVNVIEVAPNDYIMSLEFSTSSLTISDAGIDYTVDSQDVVSPFHAGPIKDAPSVSGLGAGYMFILRSKVVIQRYGPGVIGVIIRPVDADHSIFFGSAIGKKGLSSAHVVAVGAAEPIYKSEHPVTGNFLQSPNPVCWV